jgi:hypothetical protein
MNFFGGDRWADSDEEDNFQNENPPPGVKEEFINDVLNAKHAVYENTILSTDADTDEGQDEELLKKYTDCIHQIYVMAIISQNGKKNSHTLDNIPEEAKSDVEKILRGVEEFFSSNQIPDTIPYMDYIRNHFHVYPFVQNNSFIKRK